MLTFKEAQAEFEKCNQSISEAELFIGFVDLLLNKKATEVFNVPRGVVEQIHPTCLKRFLISESKADKMAKR